MLDKVDLNWSKEKVIFSRIIIWVKWKKILAIRFYFYLIMPVEPFDTK